MDLVDDMDGMDWPTGWAEAGVSNWGAAALRGAIRRELAPVSGSERIRNALGFQRCGGAWRGDQNRDTSLRLAVA